MTRRTTVLVATIVSLICAVYISSLPVSASRQRDVDPATINPAVLQLPASALPAGVIVDHNGVSDNADADGRTTPPDGHKSALGGPPVHQNFSEAFHRTTGYRLDFRYPLSGSEIGTEYLASIFPSADKAKAAMDDAIGPGSLVQLIGKPLAHQCQAGDRCSAYYCPNPGTPNNAVAAIFTHGPILIETASQVPADKFDALEPAMESTLYGFLGAADGQIKIALSGSSGPSATTAPQATNTATATATATSTPKPTPTKKPTKKPAKKCKKGYKLVHGKCKKVKKKAN